MEEKYSHIFYVIAERCGLSKLFSFLSAVKVLSFLCLLFKSVVFLCLTNYWRIIVNLLQLRVILSVSLLSEYKANFMTFQFREELVCVG